MMIMVGGGWAISGVYVNECESKSVASEVCKMAGLGG